MAEPLGPIQKAATKLGARLFRNQVGKYLVVRPDGSEQYISTGLCPGSSDLIGWYPLHIKQEMVGATVAQFLAVEVKNKKGRVSEAQQQFIQAVINQGGMSFVARSPKEFKELVEKFPLPNNDLPW